MRIRSIAANAIPAFAEFIRRSGRPLHVIGKDILIPAHGVYWPIMLKALGFADEEMPTLLVHGWWNIAGAKMSKSVGNIVDPDALADKYGAEALRYYLMSDIATGRDADFSEERLVQRYNTDLANSLGNLLNRTLNMAAKYRDGKLKRELSTEELPSTLEQKAPDPDGVGYRRGEARLLKRDPHWRFCDECERWSRPPRRGSWRRKELRAKRALDAVLYALAESLRIIAILISPILPKAAQGIFAQLNWTGPMTLSEAEWGKLPDGHQLGQPKPLFPRIEVPVNP